MADVDDRSGDIRDLDRPRDLDVAVLAERQHEVVSFEQLRELGLGAHAIYHRARTGRLFRMYRGVYSVGRRTVSREGQWLAAVFACGPQAVLSHLSAAALWGLLPDNRARTDVTVPGRTRRGSGDVLIHNVHYLHPEDRARREEIPVTSLPRTLLDIASVVTPRRHARAIDEAERRGLFDLREVDELCERSPGRRGVKRLREAIARYRPSPPMTRSDLERLFVELCDAAGLPRPAMNLFVSGHEVDALWADRRLVVEVDSYEFHRTRAAFEADRLRDTALQRAGYRILRVTDRRLQQDPAGISGDLHALLR